MAKVNKEVVVAGVSYETPELVEARVALATSETQNKGNRRDYARLLNKVMPAGWYDFDHTDKSEANKPVLAERDAFYSLLEGHSNKSQIWKDVRGYGREEAAKDAKDARILTLATGEGLTLGEATAQVEAEDRAAAEASGANSKRHPLVRYQEEVRKLIKYGDNLDPTAYPVDVMDKIANANELLVSAYVALGFSKEQLKA